MTFIRPLLIASLHVLANTKAVIEHCGGKFDVKDVTIMNGSLLSNSYYSLNITFTNNYKLINNALVLYHLNINNTRYLPQIDALCMAPPDCRINMGNRSIIIHNNIPKINETGSMKIELRSQNMEQLACIRFAIGKESLISKIITRDIIGNLTEVPTPLNSTRTSKGSTIITK